jgi:hypothetical protein
MDFMFTHSLTLSHIGRDNDAVHSAQVVGALGPGFRRSPTAYRRQYRRHNDPIFGPLPFEGGERTADALS